MVKKLRRIVQGVRTPDGYITLNYTFNMRRANSALEDRIDENVMHGVKTERKTGRLLIPVQYEKEREGTILKYTVKYIRYEVIGEK